MAAPNYRVIQIDLAVARDANAIPEAGVGVEYDGFTVLALPGGNTVSLKCGPSKDNIPLLVAGQSFAFKDVCDNPFIANEGLFITNIAGAGILLLLLSQPNRA